MPPDHPPPFPPRPPLRPAATGRRSGRALLECSDGGRSFEVNRATAQFRSRLPFHAGARADAQARLQGSSSDLRQGHMDSLKGTRITGALFRSRITTSESAVHFDAPLPEPGEQAMLPPKICLPSSTDAFLHSLRRMDLAHPRPPAAALHDKGRPQDVSPLPRHYCSDTPTSCCHSQTQGLFPFPRGSPS